jgi:hypothetical protein
LGNTLFTLNKTSAQSASKIIGLGTATFGGTLTVTNVGANNLVAGDAFTLFQATNFVGSFANLTLPDLSPGLTWNTSNLVVNGTISVSNIIYTLTYTAGLNGTVSGISPQNVTYGASGTAVSATPDTGYAFVNWSDGSIANPRTDANVTSNVNVTANFAANPVMPVIAPGSATWTGGGFSLSGIGGVGQTYILLTTPDLVQPVWTPIATNTADTNGVFNFTDTQATNFPQRFYRVTTP